MYRDRVHAGRVLAEHLAFLKETEPLILAIPRGGVMVGRVVAEALKAPLDVVVPRKLGAPENPELAIGAVMHDGTMIFNREVLTQLAVPEEYLEEEKARQVREIARRLALYRGGSDYPNLAGRSVILVDDGVATGATIEVAALWLKKNGVGSCTIAVPVGPPSTIERLKLSADRVVCPLQPEPFYAVGQFYEDFREVKDEEVVALLR